MSEFQKSVTTQPAPAVAGDFCDANPRATYNAGPGALIADAAGVAVGRFGWVTADSNGQPLSVANSGSGAPQGFLHRGQQGLITGYLDGASMVIPGGFEVTLHSEGGFWAVNDTGGAVAVGGTVYADPTTGKTVASGGGAVDSGFKYASAGADGELVKITTHAVR